MQILNATKKNPTKTQVSTASCWRITKQNTKKKTHVQHFSHQKLATPVLTTRFFVSFGTQILGGGEVFGTPPATLDLW